MSTPALTIASERRDSYCRFGTSDEQPTSPETFYPTSLTPCNWNPIILRVGYRNQHSCLLHCRWRLCGARKWHASLLVFSSRSSSSLHQSQRAVSMNANFTCSCWFSLAPPSFCKCTCYSNSTIIPLSDHSSDKSAPQLSLRAPTATCALCNRAFCVSQRLPICKDAEEKDIFTTCFQRDSRKDQIVVIAFIMVTVALLGWAAMRKLFEWRGSGTRGTRDAQQGYTAITR